MPDSRVRVSFSMPVLVMVMFLVMAFLMFILSRPAEPLIVPPSILYTVILSFPSVPLMVPPSLIPKNS